MGGSKAFKRGDVTSLPSQRPTDPWIRLAEQLEGLLFVQIDEPFVDLDHLFPRSAWLVLHLDLVRPAANIRLALDALAALCVRSERLRFDEKLLDGYWRQMLTSDVMRDGLSPKAPTVSKFIRFVQYEGVHVILSWRGKQFQSSLATHLRGFLIASVNQYESIVDTVDGGDRRRNQRVWRPLGVGIRFVDASLTSEDIKAIKAMLSRVAILDTGAANTGRSSSHLCEQHTLCKLVLRGNRMGSGELKELTRLLEDPLCRRIDDLNLAKTFPDEVASSCGAKYVAAFQRMVRAAFTTKRLPKATTYIRPDAGSQRCWQLCRRHPLWRFSSAHCVTCEALRYGGRPSESSFSKKIRSLRYQNTFAISLQLAESTPRKPS